MERHPAVNAIVAYIRFVNKSLMIRKRYTLGLENLPPEGSRYLIISNHQNTANDPINIIFALPFRYNITVMARANVFYLNKYFTKLLFALGLVPAYRCEFDGGDSVEKNNDSFDLIAEQINTNHPFLVFPEGGHTQGHYLDPFTTGFVRIAFYAAEKTGWKDDIKIVPTAHHYDDYFAIQSDFLWTIGKPLSLKPFYEEYQKHPYKVMRRIKNIMHEEVQKLMLDVERHDYNVKDFFLRKSAFNPASLKKLTLPERLQAEKEFFAALNVNPHYKEIIETCDSLYLAESAIRLDDLTLELKPELSSVIPDIIILLLLLPLFIVSLWPNAICYNLPLCLLRSDIMFTNTYRYLISALVIYPICAIVTLAVFWACLGMPWVAVVWILLWFPLARFAWFYYQKLRHVVNVFRYNRIKNNISAITTLRQKLKDLIG